MPETTTQESNLIQLNVPTECFCKTWPVTHEDRRGEHHHSLCSEYRTEKHPYLFAKNDIEQAWGLVTSDFLPFIRDNLEDNFSQTITFIRQELTDEEMFNECGL